MQKHRASATWHPWLVNNLYQFPTFLQPDLRAINSSRAVGRRCRQRFIVRADSCGWWIGMSLQAHRRRRGGHRHAQTHARSFYQRPRSTLQNLTANQNSNLRPLTTPYHHGFSVVPWFKLNVLTKQNRNHTGEEISWGRNLKKTQRRKLLAVVCV